MKKIATAVLFLLVLGQPAAVKAAWQDDANDRIEQIRKRNAELTILGTGNAPVPDVNVQIQQTRHSFGFGTCIAYGALTGSSQTNYKNFILNHYEWAVCENEMKWSSNENTNNTWTFSQADTIADWCASNGLILRGHNLVWETGGQTPSWVSGLACSTYPATSAMMNEIDDRINTTVGRYAGQIVQWDVDNEMLSGNMFDCLGETGRAHFWQQANSIDPDCAFMMNEYSGNSFGGYDGGPYKNRAQGLINLGAPIGAIGIQAHIASPFNPETYYNSVLNVLDDLGLPIMATEYDVEQADVAQRATDLENFYRICFSHPLFKGIIQWGFWQGAMWRTNAWLVNNDWTVNAAGLRYESLLNEWTTHDANYSDSDGKVNFRGFHGTYKITLSKPGEANEVHIIQLDPNTTTAYITIDTNFIAGPPDTNAPTPNPMTWASNPAATGPYSITMTATTATDANSPPVQYYFECTTDGDFNSAWQSSTTYTATGLNSNTSYSFRVKARDSSANHNETGWSSTLSATTLPPDTNAPTPNPMTWAAVPTATGAYTITMTANTATDDYSPPVEYYFECTTDGTKSSGWQSSPTYLASGLTPSTQYTFRVKARDNVLNVTGWSNSLSATTQPPPTNIEILGSWATGTTHAKESGGSRALIFIAHGELTSGPMNLGSVTYGGQAMTKVIDYNCNAASGYAYAAAYILNETGVAAATTSTFTPTWSGTAPTASGYSSAFFSNVNQTTTIRSFGYGWSIINPVTTGAFATSNGDMVVLGATCGNSGSYTLNNSFTEGNDQTMSNTATGVTGYKAATGASETPSATFSGTINRQMIIGFVLKAGVPPDTAPAAPTGLSAAAGNKSVTLSWNSNGEADMNGYNVYRSTTQGGGYAKLNGSLLTSPNYPDTGLTNWIPYYYVVTAVDLAGHESTNSNEATATPDYQSCADALADGYRLTADLAGAGDCYVNFLDFAVLAGHWLDNTCVGPGNCDGADFEPNGTVDIFDLSEFANQWLTCNDPANPDCTKNW